MLTTRHSGELQVTVDNIALDVPYSDCTEIPAGVGAIGINGWGCPESDLAEVAAQLATDGYRLVTFSMPDTVPLTLEDKVSIVTQIAAKRKLGKHAVIGHSLGGDIATEYATLNPELVAGIADVVGSHELSDRFLTRIVANMSLSEFLGTGKEAYLAILLRSTNAGMRDYGERIGKFTETQLTVYHHAAVDSMQRAETGGSLDKFIGYEGIRMYIHGEFERAAYLPKLVAAKGVEVVEIAGSDHFPNIDNPTAYCQALKNFMRQVNEGQL